MTIIDDTTVRIFILPKSVYDAHRHLYDRLSLRQFEQVCENCGMDGIISSDAYDSLFDLRDEGKDAVMLCPLCGLRDFLHFKDPYISEQDDEPEGNEEMLKVARERLGLTGPDLTLMMLVEGVRTWLQTKANK